MCSSNQWSVCPSGSSSISKSPIKWTYISDETGCVQRTMKLTSDSRNILRQGKRITFSWLFLPPSHYFRYLCQSVTTKTKLHIHIRKSSRFNKGRERVMLWLSVDDRPPTERAEGRNTQTLLSSLPLGSCGDSLLDPRSQREREVTDVVHVGQPPGSVQGAS